MFALDKKYVCGSSKSRTSTLSRILTSLPLLSSLFLSKQRTVHKQTDDWLLLGMLYCSPVNAKQRKIWRSSCVSRLFFCQISQRSFTESIWNSRRSNRFKQALGLLIHHLINSALLYSDLGPVPILLLHTSNTLSGQVKFGGLSQHRWLIAEQNRPRGYLWSDAYFMWKEENTVYKSKSQ